MLIEIVGYVAGVSLAISALPQLIYVIKERSVHGLSLFTIFLLTLGNYSWLVYGIFYHLTSMIIFDSISGTLYLVLTILKIIDSIKTRNKTDEKQKNFA